jgi:hypothetical protein
MQAVLYGLMPEAWTMGFDLDFTVFGVPGSGGTTFDVILSMAGSLSWTEPYVRVDMRGQLTVPVFETAPRTVRVVFSVAPIQGTCLDGQVRTGIPFVDIANNIVCSCAEPVLVRLEGTAPLPDDLCILGWRLSFFPTPQTQTQ